MRTAGGDGARGERVRPPRDIKLYTGKQILDNHTEYMGRRGVTSKVVGSVADDVEGRELYLGYAREDRCALWLRLTDEADVLKALRVLADYDHLHTVVCERKRAARGPDGGNAAGQQAQPSYLA